MKYDNNTITQQFHNLCLSLLVHHHQSTTHQLLLVTTSSQWLPHVTIQQQDNKASNSHI